MSDIYAPCLCGSGKKFKFCCHEILKTGGVIPATLECSKFPVHECKVLKDWEDTGISPDSSWHGIPSSFIEARLTYEKKFSFGQEGKPFYVSGPHDYERYNVEEIINKVSEAKGHFTVHV